MTFLDYYPVGNEVSLADPREPLSSLFHSVMCPHALPITVPLPSGFQVGLANRRCQQIREGEQSEDIYSSGTVFVMTVDGIYPSNKG